jgi:hypothetical protein
MMLRVGYVCAALVLWACGSKSEEGAGVGAGKGEPSALLNTPAAKPAKKVALIKEAGDEAGAKALLARFMAPDADHLALSRALRPKLADYAAVYGSEAAKKMDGVYGPAWDADQIRMKPKAGQTELLLWGATAEELKAGSGNSSKFPGGYRQISAQLKAGVRLYRFKFAKPGETVGTAFDGLVYTTRWVLIPKPWKAL